MNTVYVVRSVNGFKGFEDFLGAYDYGRLERIAPIPMVVTDSGSLVLRSDFL